MMRCVGEGRMRMGMLSSRLRALREEAFGSPDQKVDDWLIVNKLIGVEPYVNVDASGSVKQKRDKTVTRESVSVSELNKHPKQSVSEISPYGMGLDIEETPPDQSKQYRVGLRPKVNTIFGTMFRRSPKQ